MPDKVENAEIELSIEIKPSHGFSQPPYARVKSTELVVGSGNLLEPTVVPDLLDGLSQVLDSTQDAIANQLKASAVQAEVKAAEAQRKEQEKERRREAERAAREARA